LLFDSPRHLKSRLLHRLACELISALGRGTCQSALEWDPPYCRTKQCYPGVIGWAQAER
jgi:hypothetical protein